MDAIANLLSTAVSYIQTIGIADAIDILIVAYLIYEAIYFVRRTNSRNVARGILLLVVLLILSYLLGLTMLNFLLRRAMELGLIALVILFQPELRKALERMGRSKVINKGKKRDQSHLVADHHPVSAISGSVPLSQDLQCHQHQDR